MSNIRPERKGRKALVLGLILLAGGAGLVGGAIGGAAGAIWVVETIAKPRYSPKTKNAVIDYPMPPEGARPVDIAGIRKVGTPLNPCLISFLESNRDILPNARWSEVRLHPYFKIEGDIITEMAFARGVAAITRGNEITVRVADAAENLNGTEETLMFHELVHVDQYASGRMDLPDYAASVATAYASGKNAHENDYEEEAREISRVLLERWKISEERRLCHPDLEEIEGDDPPKRANSEKPEARYAIFDHETQEYRLVEHRLHDPKGAR